jgi:multiple sugar transport system ATP-binding protein
MAVVTLNALSKRYPGSGEPAVKDVSLTISDQEFMVLLGPSGCGKSTVLRMIAGLEPITAGTIAIDGRVMNQVPAKERDIAMVFQSYALYPHMDVFNNLAFGLRRRRVPTAEIDRRVRQAADKLGLTPFLRRKPHALSGGQRQRVALGRAIVRQPKVFLFDEPLSNLDAALRVSTRNELIRQQHEIGITTIYVTHDQVEAMTMGHRICIMDRGEVVQIGAPLEVYRNPCNTFVARFLGNPPMNLVPANLLPELATPPGDLLIGIRPEDLYDVPPQSEEPFRPLPMQVIAVEPLGAETLLVLTPRGTGIEIIARVGRDTLLHPGATADIWFDTSAIHLFDQTTTRALPSGQPWRDQARSRSSHSNGT